MSSFGDEINEFQRNVQNYTGNYPVAQRNENDIFEMLRQALVENRGDIRTGYSRQKVRRSHGHTSTVTETVTIEIGNYD